MKKAAPAGALPRDTAQRAARPVQSDRDSSAARSVQSDGDSKRASTPRQPDDSLSKRKARPKWADSLVSQVEQTPSNPLADKWCALQQWVDSSPDHERQERKEVDQYIREQVDDPLSDTVLIMERDTLSSLPVMPPVEHLMVMYCSQLTSFPDLSQCEQLQSLTVADCQNITTIPLLGHLPQLRTLNLTELPLESLPADLFQLRPECMVTVDVGRLSDTAINRLTDDINHPAYAGPRVLYALPASRAMSAAVVNEVTAWCNEAITHDSARLDPNVWGRLPAHMHAESFGTFLSRIKGTRDYSGGQRHHRTATQDRVVQLLEHLQYDSALRNDCFNLAEEAVVTCGDRIAMALLDMEMLCLTSRKAEEIRAGVHDANPQNLVDFCKGQYRLKVLERLTKEKSVTTSIDEVEFYLGQVLALSERYALPVKITSMIFPNVSVVTQQDMVNAESALGNQGLSEQASATNNQAYQTFLASSPLMHSLLDRVCENDMTAAKTKSDDRIVREKEIMHTQLEGLQGNEVSTDVLVRESHRLMRKFNALETEIRVQTTLPVLMGLLDQHGVSATL